MSAMSNELLASRIEAAALAVPGVASILRRGAAVRSVIDSGTRLLGIGDGPASAVRVEQRDAEVEVECTVGVVRSRGAAETVRDLHREIADVVLQLTGLPAKIRITVGHVDEVAPLDPMA